MRAAQTTRQPDSEIRHLWRTESPDRTIMPLEMEHFRQRFDEILHRVGEVPESRTPGISIGLDEIRTLLSEFVASGEELYYKIEELIAAREALERERNQYRELFDFSPDAHIVTDLSYEI